MIPDRFNLEEFISKHVINRSQSLLFEDVTKYKKELTAAVKGASVLVIGGAGTIGSSYIKALLRYEPEVLFVFDISENGLTELVRDIRSTPGLSVPPKLKLYPVDFSGEIAFKILKKEGPFDIIAHFAAHKHVRSEKDVFSIEAMYRNNVLSNLKLLEFLQHNPPKHFFCVSTDKAANPVNVMGATKRIMEELLLSFSDSMKITTARFANVAFSNGSLLDGFLTRLAKRQPLSAPNDIKRYFVSPDESGELCLLASILGENRQIFFPKLGEEQMKTFTDIAVNFLNEIGLKPRYCDTEDEAKAISAERNIYEGYPVLFFDTDTSGEKPFEEFYTETDLVDITKYESLGVIVNPKHRRRDEIVKLINEGKQMFSASDVEKHDIVNWINDVLPNFDHKETGKNLDQRM